MCDLRPKAGTVPVWARFLANALVVALMAGTLMAPLALAENVQRDPLLEARFAAVDGKFEDCAKLADQARRLPNAIWRAHNVFATCEVFAADAVKDQIGAEAYAKRIGKAVDAFNFLLSTPGVLVAEDRRRSIRYMIEELDKRIADARAVQSGTAPTSAP